MAGDFGTGLAVGLALGIPSVRKRPSILDNEPPVTRDKTLLILAGPVKVADSVTWMFNWLKL